MSDFWQRAFIYPFLIITTALILWPLAGLLPAGLFLGFAMAYRVFFHLNNLSKLDHWLVDTENRPVPDGTGAWEDVFSKLNKMMRQRKKEREQHAASLQQMEQATAALPEGVVILGTYDRIEWCNPLAENHFGIDLKRDSGQQITYLARQPEFVSYLEAGEFDEPLIMRGARHDDLVLSIKIIAYGQGKKLMISRDVTHLERIETMRRDFVANVSHELRTPLTVVNGFVETLQDMDSLENKMARHALQLMGDQTLRMENLVNDLLTLSRLENAQNSLLEEHVDVPSLIQTLLEEGKSLSQGKHRCTVEITCEAHLKGSVSELHSAFGNLVSNAIRYTPQGGEIVLRWEEKADGQAVFSVRDCGLGIAPEHIARLTERFYRVDRSRSRETGGTGLGLAIVKHIAIRHQALLNIESEEGRGSVFSIQFPTKRKWREE